MINVKDGNDIAQLREAFEEAKRIKEKPTLLIANTVKGKGSPVMEDKAGWHHKVPNAEEVQKIKLDLEKGREAALCE